RVRVDVRKLLALIPDRFDKAHQPEDVHAGDIQFVGDKGVEVGKLPHATNKDEAPSEPASSATDDDEERGVDADIHLENARLLQSPIDLSPRGTLSIRVRRSGKKVRGRLEMTKGELSLGGRMHPLEAGSLTYDDAHPEGYLDLTFVKKVPAHAMRE